LTSSALTNRDISAKKMEKKIFGMRGHAQMS